MTKPTRLTTPQTSLLIIGIQELMDHGKLSWNEGAKLRRILENAASVVITPFVEG